MTLTKEKRNAYQQRWLANHMDAYKANRKDRDHRYYLKKKSWRKFLENMPMGTEDI
jgi:hypothetical protein